MPAIGAPRPQGSHKTPGKVSQEPQGRHLRRWRVAAGFTCNRPLPRMSWIFPRVSAMSCCKTPHGHQTTNRPEELGEGRAVAFHLGWEEGRNGAVIPQFLCCPLAIDEDLLFWATLVAFLRHASQTKDRNQAVFEGDTLLCDLWSHQDTKGRCGKQISLCWTPWNTPHSTAVFTSWTGRRSSGAGLQYRLPHRLLDLRFCISDCRESCGRIAVGTVNARQNDTQQFDWQVHVCAWSPGCTAHAS